LNPTDPEIHMKKSSLAVALLAVTGAVSAQSSLTIFGVVDADITYGRGSIANRTALSNSGNASSRLGFRGTEDLGGGVSASFWLEAGLNNDDGQGAASNSNNQAIGPFNPGTGANPPARTGTQGLTFNRRSTVSLAGTWGEVRVGRDYTPQYWNLLIADPFGNVGVGLPMPATYDFAGFTGSTGVRASNGVAYFLPGNIGGFFGAIEYYMGENPSGAATSKDGTGGGIRLGYDKKPIYVSIASGNTSYAAGDTRQSNIVGTYDFGVVKLGAQYSDDKNGSLKGKGWLFGGTVPVGPGEFKASYSYYETTAAGNPNGKKFALGYVHNLSKRTAVYGTWARLENGGGAALAVNGAVTAKNGSSSGMDLGIRHSL
jgi:predicted porin